MDIISYILSRKYTDNAIVGLGSIRGANCTIDNIVHQDGVNTVTFKWTGTDGTTKTRDMVVYDGTPIYVWESGNTYHYGDLAIYESQFYRCIVENSDVIFDDTKWNEIGSPDGNYDIVQSKALLPARFTAADRKLYFVIDECIFYLWDGTQWVAQTHLVQESVMPTASAKYLGRMYQYIGATNANFTHGYVYECVSDGQTIPTFTWENVEVQPCIASHTSFDNTNSGLDATNVQDAIDEINTIKQDEMQVITMPLASVDNLGKVYQYIGVATVDYEHGCFYECISDGAVTPTYSWKNIGLIPTFVGTEEQWNALTSAQQNQYDIVNITEDEEIINLGAYLRKVKVMPSADECPSEVVMYVGATTADYTRGYIYRSVPSVVSGEIVYNWVRQDTQAHVQSDWAQVDSTADDYIKNKPNLGTASAKNFTDNVRPNSHDLVESNAVYNAISSSIASIYKPHGDLTCAQLTSDLLIAANIGNVYNMTDSGTTSALFIQGAGKTINIGDTVGIIQADNNQIMFNLMGSMIDLHDYQTKELDTPLTINGVQETEVEGALGAIVDTLENVGRYNVLDYGLVRNVSGKFAENTAAFRQMLNDIPEGSVIYFPAGVYTFNDGFEINKSLSFIGDSQLTQKNTTENGTAASSQIRCVISSDNFTLFTITTTREVTFNGLTFHAHRTYELTGNTAEFTTLPYPYFVETITYNNINCIDANSANTFSIRNCMFEGFSGYAVKVYQHKFIDNCGFNNCAIGILMTYTDSWVSNCWFNACGTAINTTSNNVLLNISDCWCDAMAHHFIKCDGNSQAKLLIDNAWVDMIDKCAIYVPNALIIESHIEGRFSRCGMMYAGLPIADKTREISYMTDVINCKCMTSSYINILVDKRAIGVGNNSTGVCPLNIISSTSDPTITDSEIICIDVDVNDIIDSNTSYYNRTKIDAKNDESYRQGAFVYDFAKMHFRTNTPIGRITPTRTNLIVVDTVNKKIYRSTGTSSNTDWEVISDNNSLQFTTVAEMKSANLHVGDIVYTINYATDNDQGGATYKIREAISGETDNAGDIIILNNGFVAEMIITKEVSLSSFGVMFNNDATYGNNNSTRLNHALSYINSKRVNMFIPKGTAYFSAPIICNKLERVKIYSNGVGTLKYNNTGDFITIHNCVDSIISHVDLQSTSVNGVVLKIDKTDGVSSRFNIEDCQISGGLYGLQISDAVSYISVSNTHIFGNENTRNLNDSSGVLIEDAEYVYFDKVSSEGYANGIIITGGQYMWFTECDLPNHKGIYDSLNDTLSDGYAILINPKNTLSHISINHIYVNNCSFIRSIRGVGLIANNKYIYHIYGNDNIFTSADCNWSNKGNIIRFETANDKAIQYCKFLSNKVLKYNSRALPLTTYYTSGTCYDITIEDDLWDNPPILGNGITYYLNSSKQFANTRATFNDSTAIPSYQGTYSNGELTIKADGWVKWANMNYDDCDIVGITGGSTNKELYFYAQKPFTVTPNGNFCQNLSNSIIINVGKTLLLKKITTSNIWIAEIINTSADMVEFTTQELQAMW